MQSVFAPQMMAARTPQSLGDQALKVGVMGSAGEGLAIEHLTLAEQLSEAVAQAGCVLITGDVLVCHSPQPEARSARAEPWSEFHPALASKNTSSSSSRQRSITTC